MRRPTTSTTPTCRSLALAAALSTAVALGGCAFPRKDYSGVPDPSVITLRQEGTGLKAVPPDCKKLEQPSQYNKADDLRMNIAFGCATYTNLADQLARPADLVSPRSFPGQSPNTAGAAVDRYNNGKIMPLRRTMSTDVGTSGKGTGTGR